MAKGLWDVHRFTRHIPVFADHGLTVQTRSFRTESSKGNKGNLPRDFGTFIGLLAIFPFSRFTGSRIQTWSFRTEGSKGSKGKLPRGLWTFIDSLAIFPFSRLTPTHGSKHALFEQKVAKGAKKNLQWAWGAIFVYSPNCQRSVKTSHFLEQKTTPQDHADAGPMGQRPQSGKVGLQATIYSLQDRGWSRRRIGRELGINRPLGGICGWQNQPFRPPGLKELAKQNQPFRPPGLQELVKQNQPFDRRQRHWAKESMRTPGRSHHG